MNKKPSKRARFFMVLLGLSLYVMALGINSIIKQNGRIFIERKVEGCLPWRAYWHNYNDKKQLAKFDLVLFPARKMAPVIADDELVGKMIVGMPGDQVLIKQGLVFVAGDFVGDVFYGAKKLGKPIDYWDKTYRLKDDELFLIGTEPRSWDSRYWGTYPRDLLIGHITLLF